MLMNMGLVGWLVSPIAGFVVGGVFFLTMKLQVEYVVNKRGPIWLLPAAMYGRMAFVGAVLVLVAIMVKNHGWESKVPAMMLGGLAGIVLARVLVARMVRPAAGPPRQPEGDGEDDDA